jgi:aspartate/methionine/tyrosine aminotransferase
MEEVQKKTAVFEFDQIRLAKLSKFIKNQASKLLPNLDDLVTDHGQRVGPLWFMNFSKGVPLSSGGVEDCFINLIEIKNNPNLRDFNMYRSDRGSVFLSQEAMKKFLFEEKAIKTTVYLKNLYISFCLGSHEGVMRIARCIYKKNINDGMLFPVNSYGLLASAVASMKPANYTVKLIKTHKKLGGKISLESLKELLQKNPSTRTLFLELKTLAGATYTAGELRDIVKICKEFSVFLIADATHINMEFNEKHAFADISTISLQEGFHEFAGVYTASKTYGLERARVGFMVFSKQLKASAPYTIEVDLYRMIGASFDLPFEVANMLLTASLEDRGKFITANKEKLRFNMNIMIAYIEGVNSNKLDSDLIDKIRIAIPASYHAGIKGLRLFYKPEGGMHLIVNTSRLQEKYLANIRMFNSEIFCYALNMMAEVVTLHAFCILDPKGFSMRLSFPNVIDVHKGMQKIHEFVKMLTDQPRINPYFSGLAENWIFSKVREKRLVSSSQAASVADNDMDHLMVSRAKL